MMQLSCPWCGVRDEAEFVCGGTTHIERPPLAASDADWAHYLFFRDNPKGVHLERWRHAFGCGQWFNLARDTVTHAVLAVYRMGDPPPRLGA
jgi:sarcosine oxidase, subunit delta